MITALKRPTRFVMVGVFNTILDFTILNTLVFAAGMAKIPANIISTTTAMCISYILNHGFVFKENNKRNTKQFLLFLGITAFGLLVIQNSVIYLLTHVFTWPADMIYNFVNSFLSGSFTKEFVELNFAKVIATVLTLFWNYQMYKRLVFKTPQPIEAGTEV